MTTAQILHAFFADDKLKAALAAIFIDFVLGCLSGWKQGNFRLSYVADFLRNDVGFKLLPWFVLYAGAKVAGQQNILIPGLDMGVVAGAAYATVMAAWVASILGSVSQLRLTGSAAQSASKALTAPENASPPKD